MPLPPKSAVNEISSPTAHTDTDDYIVLHYIINFSDNCFQPDDGQIGNGRNMYLIRYVKIADLVVL